jgi:hypothetical protein
MLLSLLLAAASAAPATGCTPLDGWNRGREGGPARAECGADYLEAHRLGDALHALKREHAELAQQNQGAAPAQDGASKRRQRQIDVDLEAIRGVATTRGWPLDVAPEIEPPRTRR